MTQLSCQDVRDRLDAFIDQEIGGLERILLGRHLDSCDACAREHRSLIRLVAALASAPSTSAPPRFLDGVTSRLASKARCLPARRAWVRRAIAAAAVLAVLAGGFHYLAWMTFRSPEPPPVVPSSPGEALVVDLGGTSRPLSGPMSAETFEVTPDASAHLVEESQGPDEENASEGESASFGSTQVNGVLNER